MSPARTVVRALAAGVLIPLVLTVAGGARRAEASLPQPSIVSVSGSQVRLDAATTGAAIEYSPGTYGSGADTFVRVRTLTLDPVVPGAGCAAGADGWVTCGTHSQSSLAMYGAASADNTFVFVPGGNVVFAATDIHGGSGSDVVTGGPAADHLYGGAGRDYVDGGDGHDTVSGDEGDDLVRGGEGNDVGHGGDGDDILDGLGGSDTLSGDEGADVLSGGPSHDYLHGGNGDDTLSEGSEADSMYGEAGDDRFIAISAPGSYIDCGPGTDAVAHNGQLDTIVDCESGLAIAYDLTAPSVAITTPTIDGHVAEGSAIPSAVGCDDAGSGVLECVAAPSVPAGRGDARFAAAAVDRAGNVAFALAPYVVDLSTLAFAEVPGAAGVAPVNPVPPTAPGGPAGPAVPGTSPAGGPPSFTIDRRLPYVSPARLRAGRRAYAKLGRWRPRGASGLRYQWQLCDFQGQGCADIPSATRRMLVLTTAMAGHRLRFRVSARVRRKGRVSTISQPSELVQGTTPVNVTPPRISGRPRVGRTLFAKKGVWNPRGRYRYQWLRCDESGEECAPIPGATRITWRVTDDDVDGTLQVQVTATSFTDRTSATAVSPATAVITD